MIFTKDKLTPPVQLQKLFGELSSMQPEASGIVVVCMASTPAPALQNLFEEIVLLRPDAQSLLKSNMRGEKSSMPHLQAVTQQLMDKNVEVRR